MKKTIAILLVFCMLFAAAPLSAFAAASIDDLLNQADEVQLSLQNGGNMKTFFTEKSWVDKDLIPHVDWMGYTDRVITDNSAYKAYGLIPGQGGVPAADDNGIVSVEHKGRSFALDTNSKSVKLAVYSDTSGITNQTILDAIPTLNHVEVDIENGYYEDFVLLFTNHLDTKGSGTTTTVTVIYEDGSSSDLSTTLTKDTASGDAEASFITQATDGKLNTAGTPGTQTIQYNSQKLGLAIAQNKKVDKVRFSISATATWRPIYILSMKAQEVSLDTLITNLPDAATAENVSNTVAVIKEIEARLTENGFTVADLPEEQKTKITTLKSEIENAKLSEQAFVPLTLTGNSNIFIANDQRGTVTDFMPFVDYIHFTQNTVPAGYDLFATYDTATLDTDVPVALSKETMNNNLTNGLFYIHELADAYKYGGESYAFQNANLTAAVMSEWRQVPYRINTEAKAIKLARWNNIDNVQAYRDYTAEQIKEAMLALSQPYPNDVEDGRYDQINLLMATGKSFHNGSDDPMNVTVRYTDGTVEETAVLLTPVPFKAVWTSGEQTTLPKFGYVWAETCTSPTAKATNSLSFVSYRLETNVQKVVDSITFEKGAVNAAYILGITARSASVKQIIDTLPEVVHVSNAADTKASLAEIDRLLTESGVTDLAATDAASAAKLAATKAAYDQFVSTAFFARDLHYNDGSISVTFDNYTTGTKTAAVIAASYADETLVDVQTFDVSISAETLNSTQTFSYTPAAGSGSTKVFVWDSLNGMEPLTDSRIEEAAVMYIGDSITHAGYYPTYVEAYYMTRFPNQRIRFINKGRSGGTASNALTRYDWDIAPENARTAYILFGMNDGNRNLYPDGDETAKATAIARAKENLEKLIVQLKEGGINSITLMTPTIYDEHAYPNAAVSYTGYNAALGQIAAGVKELATQYELPVVDFYTLTDTITDARTGNNTQELVGTDRVHPSRLGHWVMAYEMIKTVYAGTGTVASVSIDAAGESASAENAVINVQSKSETGVTYTYAPKALPMPVDSYYTDAEARYATEVPFTNELNREMITVAGLAEGTYQIAFDGTVVTTCTAAELANGVNIATLDANPGQAQAKTVLAKLNDKYQHTTNLRNLALCIDHLKSANVYDKSDTEIEAYIAETYPETDTGYNANLMRQFSTYRANEGTYQTSIETLEREARELAQPKTRTVTISKVS